MCRFIETIRIADGKAENLCYNEQRMDRTLRRFFGEHAPVCLAGVLQPPKQQGCVKCRIVYDGGGIREIAYAGYAARQVRSLRLVSSDCICYEYKSENREALNRLFAMRGSQDDVLIVRRGLLTDTSIANVALYDGMRWYTPRQPLLRGTRRESLIDRGVLREADITPAMLSGFSRVRLFNAMIGWGEMELAAAAVVQE